MGANTAMLFPLTPKIGRGTITTANTAKDGTGTVVTIATAGVNGAKVNRIKARALGTNVATVLRIFINNGLDTTTAANNTLYKEATIAATTLSEVAALADNDIPMDLTLPGGYRITATIGTTIAAGLALSCEYGDY